MQSRVVSTSLDCRWAVWSCLQGMDEKANEQRSWTVCKHGPVVFSSILDETLCSDWGRTAEAGPLWGLH